MPVNVYAGSGNILLFFFYCNYSLKAPWSGISFARQEAIFNAYETSKLLKFLLDPYKRLNKDYLYG